MRFEEVIEHISIGVAPGGTLDTMLRREAALLSRVLFYRVEVSSLDVAVRFVAAGWGDGHRAARGGIGTQQSQFPGVRASVRFLGSKAVRHHHSKAPRAVGGDTAADRPFAESGCCSITRRSNARADRRHHSHRGVIVKPVQHR
nr:hypothetical protein [Variovorax paradoxus]